MKNIRNASTDASRGKGEPLKMILLEDLSESEIKEVSQHVSDSFYNISARKPLPT